MYVEDIQTRAFPCWEHRTIQYDKIAMDEEKAESDAAKEVFVNMYYLIFML